MKNKTFLLGTFFYFLLITLISCSPIMEQQATIYTQPSQINTIPAKIELTYWHTLPGAGGKAQDELVEKFNTLSDHTSPLNIQVTSEFQGSFYEELGVKLLTAYAGKSSPDVSQLGTYEIRSFARAGVLVDLKPYIQSEEGLDTTDWPKSVLDAGAVDQGIYWLPFNIAVPVLYYNKEAFAEAGLQNPPQTWEELYQDTRLLTVKNDKTQRAGLALWNMSWPMLSAIWSEGGELTDKEYQNISLNDPIVVKTLGQFQDLVKEGSAIVPDKASGGHRGVFKNGKAAMILDSPSAFKEIYEQSIGFTPAVANYPRGVKGKIFAPGAGGVVMISTTPPEKRKAAWQFIKFMLSPKSLAEYVRKTGYVAFYPSAQKEVADILKDERYATIYTALPFVRWDFSLYNAPPIRDTFEKAWQKIFFDLTDVQATLDEADVIAEQGMRAQ